VEITKARRQGSRRLTAANQSANAVHGTQNIRTAESMKNVQHTKTRYGTKKLYTYLKKLHLRAR